ncbi:unnamed protein product [marine sediment metagenome]|uniref:Uncharacterized protein n=1 Tax=marine sediment metagenome TaxID=412755 RepID=X1BXJ4_9ZZZZ
MKRSLKHLVINTKFDEVWENIKELEARVSTQNTSQLELGVAMVALAERVAALEASNQRAHDRCSRLELDIDLASPEPEPYPQEDE